MANERNARYDESLEFSAKEEKLRKSSRKILKKSERSVEESRHQTYIGLVSQNNGFHIRTLMTFIGEIPPGSKTGMHRHYNEAAIYVLSGRGYSVIDGETVEWEEGDCLCIPMMAWHQHFNKDADRPCQYLAAINSPLMKSIGVFHIEQKDDRGIIDLKTARED
jgi:gentisate 1,2-dioxygenase